MIYFHFLERNKIKKQPVKNLTRKEEIILLSILHLKKDACLISIADHLTEVTGKKVSLTSVHVPLSRLVNSGLIDSEFGEATAIRGGRRKKIYTVTDLGFEVLKAHKKVSDILWKDYLDASALID
jgi:PadR family transcriptional regulator PadR